MHLFRICPWALPMPGIEATGDCSAPAPTARPAFLDFLHCLTEGRGSMFKVSIKGVLAAPDGRVVCFKMSETSGNFPAARSNLVNRLRTAWPARFRKSFAFRLKLDSHSTCVLLQVIPGRHVLIVTYECELIGPFSSTASHEHKAIGLFSHDPPAGKSSGWLQSFDCFCNARP